MPSDNNTPCLPCSWTVQLNKPGDGIIVTFDEITDDGVEVFETAMPLDIAAAMAEAILDLVHGECTCGDDQ